MVRPGPRRPALLPALTFLAASWCVSRSVPWPLLALPPAWGLLAQRLDRCTRGIDVAWLLAAALLGGLHGTLLLLDHDGSRAGAALVGPLDTPVERSWIGHLRESPKRVDANSWNLRLDARPEGARTSAPLLRLDLELPVYRDPDVLETLTAGTRVRVWARTRLPPPTRPTRDAIVRGRVKSSWLVEPLGSGRTTLRDGMQRWRDRCVDRLWRLYGDEPRLAVFLAAVLLGERSYRHEPTEARLRGAGLAHVLAISGMHVGIVAAGLLFLTRRWPRARPVLAAAFLLSFGWLVGWGVPVRRAVGSILLLLSGRIIGRDGDALNRLACLALLIPWFLPGGIDDAAFALSFAACAGILISLDLRRHGGALTGVWLSVGAYLGTAPLSALYFGQLAPWAPLANLLVLPLLALLLAGGYASLLLADVTPLSVVAVSTSRGTFAVIDRIAAAIDALPATPWYVAGPSPWPLFVLITAATLLATAGATRTRRAAATCFGIAMVLVHLGPAPERLDRPRVELLDVGQGQALLWHDAHQTALIDTGGRTYGRWDPGARVVRPALLRRGRRRIDRLVLSHAHADHCAGATAVLESFEVGELWLGPGWWRDVRLSDLAARARERGAAIRLVWRGATAAGMRVVSPARDGPDPTDNAGSLAVMLGVPPWTVFVPGDLDGAPLERALEGEWVGPVGALVLAHHGSRHGAPDGLFERLRPPIALVSCGKNNRFGHPHPETLTQLRARAIPLRRTDRDGTIVLSAAQGGWSVTCRPRTSAGTR